VSPMPVEEAVFAIVSGDHPEDNANDPNFDLTVIDLLQTELLTAHRAQDHAICLQLTDKGRDALTVLALIEDTDAE